MRNTADAPAAVYRGCKATLPGRRCLRSAAPLGVDHSSSWTDAGDVRAPVVKTCTCPPATTLRTTVHDGEYNQWRHRASGVTEPFQTVPGQVIEGMQLALTRGATVRGKVVDVLCRPKPHTQVRAISTDDRDNRYYVPTTRTDEQGNYELKFIRAGEQRIQTDPFWLAPNQAPTKSSRTLTLKAGEEIEGVELVSHE